MVNLFVFRYFLDNQIKCEIKYYIHVSFGISHGVFFFFLEAKFYVFAPLLVFYPLKLNLIMKQKVEYLPNFTIFSLVFFLHNILAIYVYAILDYL